MTLETIFYLIVLFIIIMMTSGSSKPAGPKFDKKFPPEKGKEKKPQ